jgi:hypothetical protein
METVYKFKSASKLRGDPQKIGEAIALLREESGTISQKRVVDEARNKKSVLHPYFDWDDKRASDAYREMQAAHLLRSIITVHRTSSTSDPITVRAFVSIPSAAAEEATDGTGTYISIADAVRVVDYRIQLVRNALRDLDAYHLRYQLLADLAGWTDGIARARRVLEVAVEKAVEDQSAPVN